MVKVLLSQMGPGLVSTQPGPPGRSFMAPSCNAQTDSHQHFSHFTAGAYLSTSRQEFVEDQANVRRLDELCSAFGEWTMLTPGLQMSTFAQHLCPHANVNHFRAEVASQQE